MLLGAHSPAGQREERVAFVTRFHGQLLKHGSFNRVAVDGREVGAVAVALEGGHEGGGAAARFSHEMPEKKAWDWISGPEGWD